MLEETRLEELYEKLTKAKTEGKGYDLTPQDVEDVCLAIAIFIEDTYMERDYDYNTD